MPVAFAEFGRVVRGLGPKTAVVLGSGLGGVTAQFRESASIPFGNIPGLVPTTVHGHTGRLAVGLWGEVPTLCFLGRLHFYEGRSPEVVTGTVRVAADLGVKRLVLTNAAGGIHPALDPGSLMAIRRHIKLVGRDAWRAPVNVETAPLRSRHSGAERAATARERLPFASPYSPRLLDAMYTHEATAGRELPMGVYAALTGPCYETPAEIRALAACGADAVGMSTALEAEAAAELGLEVAAISCITNKGAGLGAATLDHAEVLANAKLTVERLGALVERLVRE